MNINKQLNGNTCTFALDGWLDATTAPELGEELEKLEEAVTHLVFDFEKLEYISSAGLRQVVSAYRKMSNGSFKIIHANAAVMQVFKMAGFTGKLDIE